MVKDQSQGQGCGAVMEEKREDQGEERQGPGLVLVPVPVLLYRFVGPPPRLGLGFLALAWVRCCACSTSRRGPFPKLWCQVSSLRARSKMKIHNARNVLEMRKKRNNAWSISVCGKIAKSEEHSLI